MDDLDDLFERYDKYVEENLEKDVRDQHKERSRMFAVDIHRLSEERASQGAMFAYIAHSHQSLITLREKAKIKVEIAAAEVLKTIKEYDPRSVQKGGKTKDEIDATIKTDPDYLNALVELQMIEDKVGHVGADKDASMQKSYMLTSLGGDKRSEEGMRAWQKKKEEEG